MQAFKDNCRALGSWLHKNNKFEYIAYAQRPSAEVLDKDELPEEIKNSAYAEMRSCSESIEALYEVTPFSDLLVNVNADKS